MISPLARRWRLAHELRRLRREAGLTSRQLADKADPLYRQRISALENAHGPTDIANLHRVLDVLDVTGEQLRDLIQIANDAASSGWWESFGGSLGSRQALYVDLETGAETVREYQLITVPGLLQTPEYTRQRTIHSAKENGVEPLKDLEKAITARRARQRTLRAPGGPRYEAIIDEVALRRPSAPPDVVAAEMRHLASLAESEPDIKVRILTVDAPIKGYALPRSAFTIYTYPDPGDLTMVAVDTEIEDHVYHEPDDVERYVELYGNIQEAALSTNESSSYLAELADRINPSPDEP